MFSLAIIIPAYNEEKRIGKTLDSYTKYFSKLLKDKKLSNFKIIVVINASTDKTKDIVKKYKSKNLEYLDFKQGGKGFAVTEGFKHAVKGNYSYIGFVDADMSTTPEEFYRLSTQINNYDGVIASRYLSGAKLTPRNTLLRIIASRLYNSLIKSLFLMHYRDTQCGAKIFRKEAIAKIINKMDMTQWAFDLEMLYLLRKKGFVVREVPTVWSNKDHAKINFWKAGRYMALSIIRLRLVHSPFKGFVRLYDLATSKLMKRKK